MKNKKLSIRSWRPAALAALACLAMSCAAAYYTAWLNTRTIEHESVKAAQAAAAEVVEALHRYQFGLRGARGVVGALGADGLTRKAFHEYSLTRDISVEFPGARGFGFIRRVAAGEVARFVDLAKADGKPDFAIRQLQVHEGDRYVIQYIEPAQQNGAAIGLDIASEPARRAAANAAMRAGEVRLTAPITLVQATGHPAQSFLILLPVYSGFTTPPDAASREASLIGWTYAPLLSQDVLGAANIGGGGGIVSLHDLTEGKVGQPFFRTQVDVAPAGPAITVDRIVFGRRWRLTFEAVPAFVDKLGLPDPMLVLAIGLMLSVLAVIVFSLRRANNSARRRLIGEQAKLAAIVESSLDGIIGKDLHGIVQSWNRGAERIFGYSAQQAIGKSLLDLIVPAHLATEERSILSRIAQGEEIAHFQTVRSRRDGACIDVSVSVAPIRDTSGAIVGASKTVRDISDLQAAQRRIRELNAGLEEQVAERTGQLNEARKTLRTVLDAVPSMIGYWDAHLINRVANRAYHEWFGVDPETVPGTPMRALLGDAIFEANRPYIEAVMRGEAQVFERSIVGPEGDTRHALANYLPDRAENGDVRGFYVVVHDVTELVSSRQQLGKLNVLLESVLQASSEIAIIATDCEGVITVFNRGAELMLGYRGDEMVGRRDPVCLHVADEVDARGRELSLATGRAVSGFRVLVDVPERVGAERREWTFQRHDGSRLPVELVVTAMRDADGAISGFLAMAVDISERRQFEASLVQARQIAEQASAAKGQFLANMSHEIRTPMNAVLGMLLLVSKTDLTTRQLDYIEKAHTAGQSLLAILNDILDFSKIDAGKMKIEKIVFDSEAMLRDLGAILAGNHVGKPVEVLFSLPATMARWVIGDRLRLQQVLINLAGNALKFTQKGEVVLAFEEIARTADQIVLRISVRDSGIGMDAAQLQMIFDGFSQAEASISRRYGGTGLGLAISRNLVSLMGGTLHVESELGVGSCFWFDLPLGLGLEQDVLPEPMWPARAHLLLVEDNPTSGEILEQMVASLGWTGRLVISAHAAVACARTTRFDAVLMDWRLPDVDGIAAAALIRQASAGREPPVIMVTAYGQEVLCQAAQAQGAPFCDFLTKPITPVQLGEAVAKAMGGSGGAAPQDRAAPIGRAALTGLRILVVEDNALNRQVVSELLGHEGALVDLADGGLRGVEMVQSGGLAYDIVIMDMQMPDIDGLEATRRIRADGRFALLPVLAMTANVTSDDRALCLQAGMDGHVGKPIKVDQLIEVTLALCGRSAVLGPESFIVASDEGRDSEDIEDVDGIEPIAHVLLRFGGNVRAYANALQGFDEEIRRLCAQLGLGVTDGGAGSAGALLHTMKGLAATLGARALMRDAAQLERLLDDGGAGASLMIQDCERLLALGRCAHLKLQAALEPMLEPEPTAAPLLEMDAWRRMLAVTVELLRGADMQALDAAHELAAAAPEIHRETLRLMVAHTQRLDFSAAAEILEALET